MGQDTDRRIIRIGGADAVSFLQGLVTNDVTRIGTGMIYAAMLTPQGKYIADFFLTRDGEDILLDVDGGFADALIQRLTLYRLRADVTIEQTDLRLQRGLGTAPDGAFADPRHPEMGWRRYGAQALDDGTDWDALQVRLEVPQTGRDLTSDSYILEMGFERLNGVDFRKGCYVGQEVTARMKHKTELRKGLARVSLTGDAIPGAEITSGGKAVGTLGTVTEGAALAYLRFDRAGPEMQADGAIVAYPPR